jgi:hypothetical protein
MSSVQTHFAQPITRKFIVTQNDPEEYGAYYFTQSVVDEWLADNSSNLTTVGSLVIISGNFADVMDNLGGPSPRFENRKTLTDMGKEIVIGNSANSRLIVLRLVQGQNEAAAGGLGGTVAYICVENNTTDTPSNSGRFTPRVARI